MSEAVGSRRCVLAPFTFDLAARAAGLRPITRSIGLSLGDRSCLALAADRGLPALTADRAWTKVAAATGVPIILIR